MFSACSSVLNTGLKSQLMSWLIVDLIPTGGKFFGYIYMSLQRGLIYLAYIGRTLNTES